VKEQLTQGFTHFVHSPVESTRTKHSGHQARTTDKANRFFYVTSEILSGYQKGSSYFRITCLSIHGFYMVQHLKDII
jgi:hypothetical protein